MCLRVCKSGQVVLLPWRKGITTPVNRMSKVKIVSVDSILTSPNHWAKVSAKCSLSDALYDFSAALSALLAKASGNQLPSVLCSENWFRCSSGFLEATTYHHYRQMQTGVSAGCRPWVLETNHQHFSAQKASTGTLTGPKRVAIAVLGTSFELTRIW